MKKILALLLFTINLSAQENFNLELVGQFPIPEGANDVWAFTSNDGKEIAVVGTRHATKIIDISTPEFPVVMDSIPGTHTNWRDIKYYNDHIYVTTDGNVTDGLLIIDVSDLRDSIKYHYINPAVEITDGQFIFQDTVKDCHNLYIDEKGYAYVSGCNPGAGGVLIFDLNESPWNPQLIGIENEQYAHDVYVQGDLMYCSEIYQGRMAIYDISDRTNPIFINGAETTTLFTHNIWVSDDGNYAFTTDEKPYGNVDAYDISDLNDIKRIDYFFPAETREDSIIPHNTHYLNGYLITSWYTDGVVIIDANKPDNLVKVGSYDTWLNTHGGYNGCWGAFPYTDSGLVLASDRSSGLYILRPNYQRAAYLEGTITSSADGTPINGVEIRIDALRPNIETSNALGDYKTGIAEAGNYMVHFTHKGYQSKSISVDIISGEVTKLDVTMDPEITATSDFDNHAPKISPNPFWDFINIESEEQIESLKLISSKGHVIRNMSAVNQSKVQLNVELPSGIYFLEVMSQSGKSAIKKIVRE